METTRKYPRTMAEAFPHEARHAYAIEKCESVSEKYAGYALAIAIGMSLAVILAAWWSS